MLKSIEQAGWILVFLAFCWLVGAEAINASWHQGPKTHASKGGQRTTETNSAADKFSYQRVGVYIDLATSYCTSKSPNEQAEWGKKFICESKITDAVIACLTLFLVFFTGLLVRVGFKQERTTRQHLRAFVYLHEGNLYNIASPLAPLPGYVPTGAQIISPTEGPLASLTIKNTGSTPAYRVVHWSGIYAGEFPLKGELPPREKVLNVPWSAIPPGGLNTKMIKILRPLTNQEIAGLRNGTFAIWVYGEITYRDAFRRKRRTNYRLFHNASTGTIGISTGLTWADGGNEAT